MTDGEFFKTVWFERAHVSEISGRLLCGMNDQFWHWQFAHILPKSIYPKFRHDPRNIMLMKMEEHALQTEQPHKTKKLPEWKKFWDKYDELRQEYHSNKCHLL